MAIYTHSGELTKVRGGGSARGIRPSSQRSEPVGNGGREREREGGGMPTELALSGGIC